MGPTAPSTSSRHCRRVRTKGGQILGWRVPRGCRGHPKATPDCPHRRRGHGIHRCHWRLCRWHHLRPSPLGRSRLCPPAVRREKNIPKPQKYHYFATKDGQGVNFGGKPLFYYRRRRSQPRQSAEDVYFSKSGEQWDGLGQQGWLGQWRQLGRQLEWVGGDLGAEPHPVPPHRPAEAPQDLR